MSEVFLTISNLLIFALTPFTFWTPTSKGRLVSKKALKIKASTRTILVTLFLKVILRFTSHLKTTFSENN